MSFSPKEREDPSSVLARALQGDVEAQFKLSCLLLADGQTELAGGWFKKAALNGHIEAAYRVAMLCLEGDAISRTDAGFWLQKAADCGYAPAQYQLGRMHELGIGTKVNPDLALRWYRLAAEHGDKDAKEKLESLNRFIDQIPPSSLPKQKRELA